MGEFKIEPHHLQPPRCNIRRVAPCDHWIVRTLAQEVAHGAA
jgi:hypothetical protein